MDGQDEGFASYIESFPHLHCDGTMAGNLAKSDASGTIVLRVLVGGSGGGGYDPRLQQSKPGEALGNLKGGLGSCSCTIMVAGAGWDGGYAWPLGRVTGVEEVGEEVRICPLELSYADYYCIIFDV